MIKEKTQVRDLPPMPAAGVKRIIAGILDLGLVLSLVYYTLKYFVLQDLFDSYFPGLDPRLQQVVVALYFQLLFVAIPDCIFSQSIGMFFLGIKVISKKNERLHIVSCLVRDLVAMPLVIFSPTSIFNDEGRALHDKIAGSIVVEAK